MIKIKIGTIGIPNSISRRRSTKVKQESTNYI